MPTPFELQNDRPIRSVFGNYTPATASREDLVMAASETGIDHSQFSIDSAVARLFLYGFLAKVFEAPEPDIWRWLTSKTSCDALRSASFALAEPALNDSSEQLSRELPSSDYADFAAAHLNCFGHTVRGDCPMNEIEYGDIKADPLFQPHRLSDLGAFFAAFGLELTSNADERIDHISIELEFMSILAAKEAHSLTHHFDPEALEILRDAQKKFLREHLGRWSPAFARRLTRMAEGSLLGVAGKLLAAFIQSDCNRFDVPAGSEDLLLRPVDDSTERLCDSCGIHNLPPGAATSGIKL